MHDGITDEHILFLLSTSTLYFVTLHHLNHSFVGYILPESKSDSFYNGAIWSYNVAKQLIF